MAASDLDPLIGALVHQKMAEHGLSQQGLAAVLGIHQSTLSRKLYGDVAWAASEIIICAEVFNCRTDDLLPTRPRRERAKLPGRRSLPHITP